MNEFSENRNWKGNRKFNLILRYENIEREKNVSRKTLLVHFKHQTWVTILSLLSIELKSETQHKIMNINEQS